MAAEPEVCRLRAIARLALLVLANTALLLAYALSPRSARQWRRRIQVWWCDTVCRVLGLKVRIDGSPLPGGPALICANHVSYLDIVVISRSAAGIFVAKSDVAGWPLFGIIARLTGTVFVDRTPGKVREQRETVDALIAAGERLILFPEGTSTDGTGVAPFKSSLFEIARPGPAAAGGNAPPVLVQPVSIAYTRTADGVPLAGARTDWYGWYGEMTLAPHLFRVAGMRGAEVALHFHPPIDPATVADRKALAETCRAAIAAGVDAAHAAATQGQLAVVAAATTVSPPTPLQPPS